MTLSLLEGLLPSLHPELGRDQKRAMALLGGTDNVFITGGAGTGKSYLMQKFLEGIDPERFPVLASTGAAAVLVGGRTFHSFFGLGILEGGPEAAIERACGNRRVVRRIKKAAGVFIDEISMIPGQALEAAERIARFARARDEPWGGLRVIAVGDFAQLPPISRGPQRDWAFRSAAWKRTGFRHVMLEEMMRTKDDAFARILNSVREGQVTDDVRNLLDWRSVVEDDPDFEGSILFARREDVARLNQQRLNALEGELREFETVYAGEDRWLRSLQANLPVPDKLQLKKNALVMLRQNDPMGRWVNGSLGRVAELSPGELTIRLLNGRTARVPRQSFRLLDAEGNEMASATNFPVSLAYAVTIHKAQGATLDRVRVDLSNLWEPGQAYVALSRVRSSDDLWLDAWKPSSIKADPLVQEFHRRIRAAPDPSPAT